MHFCMPSLPEVSWIQTESTALQYKPPNLPSVKELKCFKVPFPNVWNI